MYRVLHNYILQYPKPNVIIILSAGVLEEDNTMIKSYMDMYLYLVAQYFGHFWIFPTPRSDHMQEQL